MLFLTLKDSRRQENRNEDPVKAGGGAKRAVGVNDPYDRESTGTPRSFA